MNRKNCILMMLLGVTFAISAYGWDLPLSVDVSEISFNYTSGSSTDGISLRNDDASYVLAPEWSNGSQTKKFAYIRNTSAVEQPTVKVKFYCADYDTTYDTTPLTIFAVGADGEPLWHLNETDVDFNSSTSESADFSTDVEIFSNTVGAFYVDWAWRVSKIDGVQQVPSIYIDATSNDYFVVFSAPISPQSEPWVGVLEKACVWANATTSEDDCRNALVSGLYEYAIYDGSSWCSNSTGCIDLVKRLDFFNKDERRMDCADFSNFTNVLLASQGIGSSYRRENSSVGIHGHCLANKNPSNPSNWGSPVSFGFHQISATSNGNIIDATIYIDQDPYPDQQPPRDPYLPKGDNNFTFYQNKALSTGATFSSQGSTTLQQP